MNIILKRILGASLALAAFSFIPYAKAQTCVTPPTCESLGYTLTETDCEGHNFLKCPFDTSVDYCDSGSGSFGFYDNPPIGAFLYSDMNCSISLDKSKTVIGIIFDTEHRLAIALNSKSASWSSQLFDIPELPNIEIASDTDRGKEVISDWSGKSNTKIIINYCRANGYSCPAAEYAYSYTTEGTKAGDWYLPAAGELEAMSVNISVLNSSLSLIEGSSRLYNSYWSSNEMSTDYAWDMTYDSRYGSFWGYVPYKRDTHPVRPVIQF